MHDDLIREPLEKNPGHSTGPRSPSGKARSSMNRLDHGCRSEQLILPSEDPAEWEFTLNGWLQAYDPQDPVAETLVYEAAKAHWFFKRNEKHLHQIEVRLPADAWQWTEDNIKLFTNFTRYKTTAERSFYRAFNTLEAYCKRQADLAAQAEKARALAAGLNIQWLNRKKQEADEPERIDQWIHVFGDDQICSTTFAPTNDEIKEMVAKRPKQPEVITRHLYFPIGVPSAYDWTYPDLVQRNFKAIGVQTMLYTDWLEIVARERSSGTGHVGPAPSTQILTLPPETPGTPRA